MTFDEDKDAVLADELLPNEQMFRRSRIVAEFVCRILSHQPGLARE